MPDKPKPPIAEDMPFQQREWIAERIGWAVMALFVVAGLLGVFYSGLLSETQAAAPDRGVVVDYQRFAHRTARGHFRVRVAGPLSGDVQVRLSPSFVEAYDVEALHPHSIRETDGASGLQYTFMASPSGDLSIEIGARPKRFGILRMQIAVEGRGSVSLIQLIYP